MLRAIGRVVQISQDRLHLPYERVQCNLVMLVEGNYASLVKASKYLHFAINIPD